MTIQITVRLPSELVEFIDSQVAGGLATSRASMVARAVERERRHLVSMEDARIYASEGDDSDLAAFSAHAAATTPDVD